MKTTKDLIAKQLKEIDLLIVSSGFEDRSLSLAYSLDPKLVKKTYIFHLEDNYAISEERISSFKAHLFSSDVFRFPKNRSFETYQLVYKILSEYLEDSASKTKLKICIDITAFTREVLLIIIRIITQKDILKIVDIELIYTPSEKYSPWLSKGVRKIRSIIGYSGLLSPTKKTLLVVLSGLEEDRMHTIIDSFEPSNLLIGHSTNSSSISPEVFELSEQKYDQLKEKYSEIILDDGFTFSCDNVVTTQESIQRIVDKYDESYNIIIAPLNNKISTLGVAFAALKNENIQVCYASANQYNINNYSKGCDFFYTFSIKEIDGNLIID